MQIDHGEYLRVCRMRPVERAASPIIDHNIELTELAADSRGWYRGVRRGQRAQARELQEACYRYWEIGCEKVAVKNASNGKVRYEDVYAYFRRELVEIGVETSEEFSRILLRRLKRLSKKSQAR